MLKESQLVSIFCEIDNFCKELDKPKLIGKKLNNPTLYPNAAIFNKRLNANSQLQLVFVIFTHTFTQQTIKTHPQTKRLQYLSSMRSKGGKNSGELIGNRSI